MDDKQTERLLRPYMCWSGAPADGAVLAWAYTAQHARQLAYPSIADWTDCGFIDVRARRLREHPAYYETMRLSDGPHVNDNPPCCKACQQWGHPPLENGGGCTYCEEDSSTQSKDPTP